MFASVCLFTNGLAPYTCGCYDMSNLNDIDEMSIIIGFPKAS